MAQVAVGVTVAARHAMWILFALTVIVQPGSCQLNPQPYLADAHLVPGGDDGRGV